MSQYDEALNVPSMRTNGPSPSLLMAPQMETLHRPLDSPFCVYSGRYLTETREKENCRYELRHRRENICPAENNFSYVSRLAKTRSTLFQILMSARLL